MKTAIISLTIAAAAVWQIQANPVAANDVTATLGPNFFFDTAATGGGDTPANTTSVNFTRDFGALSVGLSTIEITGLGWATGGNLGVTNPTTFFAEVTITFLGADNVVDGGDDVVIGTALDDYTYTGAGEYAWLFTTPVSANIIPNDTVNDFLITMNGYTDNTKTTPSNLRFKTTIGTGLANAKLSVAGTITAVPEPATLTLVGLGLAGCFMMLRRR